TVEVLRSFPMALRAGVPVRRAIRSGQRRTERRDTRQGYCLRCQRRNVRGLVCTWGRVRTTPAAGQRRRHRRTLIRGEQRPGKDQEALLDTPGGPLSKTSAGACEVLREVGREGLEPSTLGLRVPCS